MAERQTSSAAALNVILSDTNNSSDGDDDVHLEDQDCGVVASTDQSDQDCNEINTEKRSTSSSAVSLLSILKAPRLSDLSRKRKVVLNPPPKGKRSARRTSKTTVNIKPDQRVKEYPGEHFTVSNAKLFCEACREVLNMKKSSINNHIQSAKHKDRVARLRQKEKRNQTIVQALQRFNESNHPRGETLPIEHQAYRVKVVRTFLGAAVPLNKLDKFRNLLEESAFSLSDRRHMSDHIPFILAEERAMLKRELTNKHVSVTFDGTTRLGEAMAVVVRYVSDEWTLEQRVVKLQMLAKSMKGEEVARELIHILATENAIDPSHLIAAMHDRASVNDAAMKIVRVIYPNLLDVGCFSHTLDLVGEHFHTPTLSEFGVLWVSLFAHSPKARMLWRDHTSLFMPSYSPTRWWSRWEMFKQVMLQFGDVEEFLKGSDVSPTTRTKLLSFFSDSSKKANLQIELATIVDYGEPFVKSHI